jgi:hypothetical protein
MLPVRTVGRQSSGDAQTFEALSCALLAHGDG